MTHSHAISLGFAEQKFPPGVHICQIFNDDDERQDALLKYLLSGLQGGECISCFSEKVRESLIEAFLAENGISYDSVRDSGRLNLSGTREIYFAGDRFDPGRMLDLLTRYHQDSVRQGYPAARVIGEMTPEVEHLPGGNRLLEYESKVSLLLKDHPVTAVCQYDARSFSGAMIMDILKVHPLMLVGGAVVHNPYYIVPETFLASLPESDRQE
jgi:hypothetical protein